MNKIIFDADGNFYSGKVGINVFIANLIHTAEYLALAVQVVLANSMICFM